MEFKPIVRLISTFYKNVKGSYHDALVEEIEIDLPLDKLKQMVQPKNGDPLLYEPYFLNVSQIAEFNKIISKEIKPDFNLYDYVLECWGV